MYKHKFSIHYVATLIYYKQSLMDIMNNGYLMMEIKEK